MPKIITQCLENCWFDFDGNTVLASPCQNTRDNAAARPEVIDGIVFANIRMTN